MSVLSLVRIVFVVCAGTMLCASPAHAWTCKTVTSSSTISIPDMAVPRDAVVGTKVGGSVSSGEIIAFSCTNEPPLMSWNAYGVKAYGAAGGKISGRTVYLLGKSGLGYRVGIQPGSSCNIPSPYYIDGGNTFSGDPNSFRACATDGMLGVQPMKASIVLDFYKMGDLNPGKIAAQDVAAIVSTVNETSWIAPESVVRSTAFTLTSQGCSVTNTKITVPMGTVNSSSFRGVGSTTGAQSFSIPLSCDAGIKVGLTVSGGGAGNWKADSGLINLDTSAISTVASGVKLQILSDGSPIKLDSLIDLGVRVSKGTFNIPLTARYYQSEKTITAGRADATATFTMKYQ